MDHYTTQAGELLRAREKTAGLLDHVRRQESENTQLRRDLILQQIAAAECKSVISGR